MDGTGRLPRYFAGHDFAGDVVAVVVACADGEGDIDGGISHDFLTQVQ